MSENWNPITVYIVGCLLITIIQITMIYLKYKKSPSLSGLMCNMSSCIMCSLIIYFILGLNLLGWLCTSFLILCMMSCCVSAISGTTLEKYTIDPIEYTFSLFS